MSNTCYYCGIHKSVPKYVYVQKLYKDAESKFGLGITGLRRTTKYYEHEVEIARCESCFANHDKYKNFSMYISGGAFLLTAVCIFFFVFPSYFAAMIGGVAMGAFVYFLLSVFIRKKQISTSGIKDEEDVKEYPPVKAALAEGWTTDKP